MPTPVLVIHGIAQRREQKYERLIAKLNAQLGDQYELIPVFWGDLGANDEHLDRLMGQYDIRSKNIWSMMADSAARPVVSGLGRSLSWLTRKRGDQKLAEDIRHVSKQNTHLMDTRVRGYLNEKFQTIRRWITSAVLPWVADVIVYQSHSSRQRIHERVRQVMAERLPPGAGTAAQPVHILAHSLGGIIAFDMAMASENPLHIAHLVTLGSQPAFFHVLDPREGLTSYEGEPVTLKPTIAQWTNIWDEFDMLAFGVSEVFRLHDGRSPTEVPVKCYPDALRGAALFRGHLGYWDKKPAIKRIREALSKMS